MYNYEILLQSMGGKIWKLEGEEELFLQEGRFVKFGLFIWGKSIIIEKGLVVGNHVYHVYFDSFILNILENIYLGKEWDV